MKKFFTFILIAFISVSSYSQATITKENVSSELNKINNVFISVIPENTLALNVWPEAHIGKFFPAFPPHFGAGISVSGTLIDTAQLKQSSEVFIKKILEDVENVGLNLNLKDKLLIPTCAINARIGGFFLPFDIGVYAISTLPEMIKDIKFSDFTAKLDYMSLGADLRYAIYEGNVVLPKISFGLGYSFTKQQFDFTANKTQQGTMNGINGTININGKAQSLIKTHTLFAQLQVSKKIFMVTPFIGGRAYYTIYDSGYNWDYKTTLTTAGITPIEKKEADNKYAKYNQMELENLQAQIYAGLGIHLPFVQISINASWNPKTNYWSGGLSTCFKM